MYSITRSSLKAGLVLAALSLTASGFAQTLQETAGPYTNVNSNGPVGDPLNEVRNYNATGGYNFGSIKISGTFTANPPPINSFLSEARIQITAPNGISFSAQPFTTAASGTESAVNFSVGRGALGNIQNAAGSWSFRFFESFDDNDAATPENDIDGTWSTVKFDYFDFVAPANTPQATDLGTLGYTGSAQAIDTTTGALAANGIKWYKFTLSQNVTNAAGRYLDIFTDVAGVTGPGTDSEIGLYGDDGSFISTDDDDGTGNYSALSYGQTTPTRPLTGGVAGNGRDGSLNAGTYYLAVGGFNSTFANNFGATSTAAANGGYALHLRAAPAPSSVAVMAMGGLMPMIAFARRRRAAK